MEKTLASLLLVFVVCFVQAQTIKIAPVPSELFYSKHNDDFTVSVRTPGGEWQDLFEYKVLVDLDKVQEASMVQFDFEGVVEMRVKYNKGIVRDVQIRPENKGVKYSLDENIIYFSLDKPAKLSLEVNGDRLSNLQVFANEIEKDVPKPGDPNVIYFGPGFHRPKNTPSDCFNIPSNTTVYLAPGAVVNAKFVCDKVENVRFIGRGIILESQRGFEITFSKNILIDGLTVINPAHYTVYGGQSTGLKIRNLKSFSCKGWSDGIDLMSCSDVDIDDIYMRNSDDCLAIYTHRWDYYGNACNYNISNAILWADVAHPINIGLHGDASKPEGAVLENIHFKDIDILEHDEDDRDYQGCMSLNASDLNLIRNVSFENVRVEKMQEGQLFNLRVLFNQKYSNAPGHGIQNILFKNIYYNDRGENPSVVEGYSDKMKVEQVVFENIFINGKKAESFKDANIKIGDYTDGISIR